MRRNCRLCLSEAELSDSHIIPAFVYRWLKETSATGFLRFGIAPNRRLQDGHKRFWLCQKCEGRFNLWETEFANTIFHPFNKEGHPAPVKYRSWLLKFCVSVSWRVLSLFMEEEDLDHFSENLRADAKAAHTVWRNFLLDKVPHPGKYAQHFLPLDAIESFTGPDLPSNINRYILRSVDLDAVSGRPNAFVYSKLARFVIVGFISMEHPSHWQGTKVHLNRGTIQCAANCSPQSGDNSVRGEL